MVKSKSGPPNQIISQVLLSCEGTVIDVLPGSTRLIVFRDPCNIIRILAFYACCVQGICQAMTPNMTPGNISDNYHFLHEQDFWS